MVAKPERCQRCGKEPGIFGSLDQCVICARWICGDCDGGKDWRNPKTEQEGYACKPCCSHAIRTTGIGSAAGGEAIQYLQKQVLPDLQKWVDDLLHQIRLAINDDARKFAEDLAPRLAAQLDPIQQRISASVQQTLRSATSVLRQELREAAPEIVAATGVEIDGLVQRNLDYAANKIHVVIHETIDALKTRDHPLLKSLSHTIAEIHQAAERINEALSTAHAVTKSIHPFMERIQKADSGKTAESIVQTFRTAKEIVEGIERVFPQIQQALDRYLEEKERERAYDWGVIFRNSALGLLVASLLFGIYYKLGEKINPLMMVRVVWLAVSLPVVLTLAHGVVRTFRELRRAKLAGPAGDLIRRSVLSPQHALGRVVMIVVLVAANILLSCLLR